MRAVLFTLFGVCTFFATNLSAQNAARIDSLRQLLRQVVSDSAKTEVYLEISKAFDLKKPDSALVNARTALGIAESIGYKKGILKACYDLGVIYQCDYFDTQEAATWFQKVIQTCENTNDSTRLCDACYNLGLVLLDLGDEKRAIQYLIRSVNVAEMQKRSDIACIANLELANIHANSPTERFAYLQRALRASESQTSDITTRAQVRLYLGEYYQDRGLKSEAKVWFQQAIEICQKDSLVLSEDVYLQNLIAFSYFYTDQNDLSEKWIKQVISTTKDSIGSLWYTVNAIKLLGQIYHKQGKDSLAYETLQGCYELNDSLTKIQMNMSAQRRILGIESTFDVRQKAKELELLKTTSRYQLWTAVLMTTLALTFGAFAFYFYRIRRSQAIQNEQLSKMIRTKDKILSIVSHDVRSPINALENILHLFDENLVTTEDIQTVTTQVHASVQNLSQNLDNLFVWAQNQQKDLSVHPEIISLKKLATDQAVLFQQRFEQKMISISVSIDADVKASVDPMHARLVLQNVLGNALKFTPSGGSVRISGAYDGLHTLLIVSDTGIGLESDAQQKIFNPDVRYTRLGTEGEPGSGLGLVLTRDLLLLNGGDLRLEPNSNQNGVQVTICFARD